MKKISAALLLLVSLFTLSGCFSSDEDELRHWMNDLRANARPRVTPLKEPKQFQPQSYSVNGLVDPFNQTKLTLALRRDSSQLSNSTSILGPELTRRKESLELYPLDVMTMVGSLNKAGSHTALVKVDNLIHQVKVGNYLGQNYGKILSITESSISLREIVQDTTGDWIERQTTLDLQEGKK